MVDGPSHEVLYSTTPLLHISEYNSSTCLFFQNISGTAVTHIKNIYFFIREENTEIVRVLGLSEQDFQISTNYSLLFKLENGLAILSG